MKRLILYLSLRYIWDSAGHFRYFQNVTTFHNYLSITQNNAELQND